MSDDKAGLNWREVRWTAQWHYNHLLFDDLSKFMESCGPDDIAELIELAGQEPSPDYLAQVRVAVSGTGRPLCDLILDAPPCQPLQP